MRGQPTHPGGNPHAAPDVPLHPLVRAATPRRRVWTQAALSWIGAGSTAVLFLLVGAAIDHPCGTSAGRIAAIVALALLAALCAGLGAWLVQRAEAETERALRRATVSRIFDLGVAGSAGRSGSLLSLTTDATERTAHYRAGFLGPITAALTTPFLVLAIMAIGVDPLTAGCLALFVLLVPLLIGGFQRLVRPVGISYRRSQGRLTAAFLEAIQALDTLVYARAAGRTAAELAEKGEEHRRGLMKLLAGNQLLIFVVDAAFSLTVVVAAASIATARVAAGELTLGQGIAILLLATLVIGPVDVVGQFFYIGISGRAAQKQLSAHLGTADSPAAADEPGEPDGAIVLEDVTAGWPGAAPVLRGLSLRVAPGERVALVGPSGVGKSTTSALIQAHIRPRAGRVLVDGLDVATADSGSVRARLAVVEQRTSLFLGTIAENLRIAAPDAGEERLWEALDMAGLREEVKAMPQGLDTPVGEHGDLLSGGQAQRLSIARAALRDAPILLLDEPTSQVDLAGEAAILAALDRLAQGRTVLMIAHRPGAILAADRVVALSPEGVSA